MAVDSQGTLLEEALLEVQSQGLLSTVSRCCEWKLHIPLQGQPPHAGGEASPRGASSTQSSQAAGEHET